MAEPFLVPSGSMEPTLHAGDHVLVDKLAYRSGLPARGDLIVFHRPRTGEIMLKRVVAVAGDQVGIEDGVLHVNGRAKPEPFVDHRRDAHRPEVHRVDLPLVDERLGTACPLTSSTPSSMPTLSPATPTTRLSIISPVRGGARRRDPRGRRLADGTRAC